MKTSVRIAGLSAPAITAALLTISGCSAGRDATWTTTALDKGSAASRAAQVAEIEHDPLAYLHTVARNCHELDQYTLTMTRQERRGLGLFYHLQPTEHVQCWFRRSPFSLRMKWLDTDLKYGETTYVAGQENDRVRFVPRWSILGLKPGIVRVDLDAAVRWGEAKYPLTDFGLERLIEQTFKFIGEAGADASIRYVGLETVSGTDRPAYYIRIDAPAANPPQPSQDLFIDPNNDLPLATRIYNAGGKLEAAYIYDNLDTNVQLSDDDFLLEAERDASAADRSASAARE